MSGAGQAPTTAAQNGGADYCRPPEGKRASMANPGIGFEAVAAKLDEAVENDDVALFGEVRRGMSGAAAEACFQKAFIYDSRKLLAVFFKYSPTYAQMALRMGIKYQRHGIVRWVLEEHRDKIPLEQRQKAVLIAQEVRQKFLDSEPDADGIPAVNPVWVGRLAGVPTIATGNGDVGLA